MRLRALLCCAHVQPTRDILLYLVFKHMLIQALQIRIIPERKIHLLHVAFVW